MTEQLEVNADMTKQKMLELFGDSLQFDTPLAEYSSFHTGGKAAYFLQAKTVDQTAQAVSIASQQNIPFIIIGGGSNLLISDDGYNGLILKIDITGLQRFGKTGIDCGAGEELMTLVNYAVDNGLRGVEFASGIWGSIGGAVYGNAGAYGGEIKDVLTEILLVDSTGKLKTVTPEYCKFGYRESALKDTKEIILSVKVELQEGNRQELREKVDDILATRASKHPVNQFCAGSFFKNIPDKKEKYGKLPAGRLLEEVGAKELSVGGAKVYEKHANIIINDGSATSKDIRELADILKQKVFDTFGITLEDEVVSIGKFK